MTSFAVGLIIGPSIPLATHSMWSASVAISILSSIWLSVVDLLVMHILNLTRTNRKVMAFITIYDNYHQYI